MYYGIDSDGRIVGSDSNEILPVGIRDSYPASFADLPSLEDQTAGTYQEGFLYPSVSSGDSVLYNTNALSDAMMTAYAMQYPNDIYPNSAAVEVFKNVLEGLDYDVYYCIYSGSTSSTCYLLYSEDASATGSTLSFAGDVTMCSYYRYRPNSSSSWLYRYSVQENVGDQSVAIGTSLVYTNLIDGYPDIHPNDGFHSPHIKGVFMIVSIFIVLALLLRRKD